MNSKKKYMYKWIKAIFILSASFLLVLFTNIYVETNFCNYNEQLRNFYHFLAGIIATELIYIAIDDFKFSVITYGLYCLGWESWQLLDKGYFQFAQLLFDAVGIAFYISIKRFKNSWHENGTKAARKRYEV